MAEPIKQEIVNTIYDNGEGLITGPVLQEVLLDMVDDYNDKVQAVDLSDSTGSWDDASDWVTENSGSIPTDEDLAILTGSIENWVEDQNYATTASVNELSESLNERIDNIITGSGVDLSGYLTTASYQIDSASFDERINSIPIPDLSEYATTESLNQVSESLAQEIADIDIPDISGLATTSSVEELSSSLNQRIDDIPQVDLSGYATTESVNEATQSVKEWVEAKHYLTTASLSGSVTEETVGFMINDATASVKEWVGDQDYATNQSVTDLSSSIAETISEITGSDLSGYLTTASYLVDSASFDERIDNIDIPDVSIYATTESLNNLSESIANTYATEEFVSSSIADIEIPSIEGLATTESVNQLSESVAQTIADLPQVDLSEYATTSSVNTLVNETSESIKSWVEGQGYLTEHQDISGLATTSSVNELSESLNQRIDDIDIPDVSIYATTQSVNVLSESLNTVSASFDQRISEITGSDISGYLTTASYLVDSASFDQRIESIPQVDLSGYATTSSVNTLSQSIADTIDNLEIPDVSGLATTESVNQLSSSIAQDFDNLDIPDVSGFATTSSVSDLSSSVGTISASLDQRINDINIPDVSVYATTASLNSLSESVANDFDNLDIPDISGLATTSSVNQLSESVAQAIADIDIPDVSGLATTSSVTSLSESIAQDFDNLDIPDVSGYLLTSSYQVDSASFDQRINNISGSDLSIYATTESVNQLSESVDSLAATVDEHTQDISDLWLATIGYDGSDITDLGIGVYPNYYCEITESVELGFSNYPADGQMISINVHNLGASASLVNIPEALGDYTCVVNGVEDSGSCSIPAGEYGDIVVTRADDKLYFRTSIDVSNISVDLSGYATTASLQNYVPNSATSSLMESAVEETFDEIENLGCEPDNPIMLSFYNAGCMEVVNPAPYYYHPDDEYPYIYDSTEPSDEGDEFLGWVDIDRAATILAGQSNEIWCNADDPNPDIKFSRPLFSWIEADGNPALPIYHTRLKIEEDWDEELQETLPRTATFNYQNDYHGEGFPVELEVWNESSDIINYFQIPDTVDDGAKGIIYNGNILSGSLNIEIEPRTAKFFTLREWGDYIYIDTLSGYASQGDLNNLSSSLNQRIDNIITGSGVDLSGYATTASVNQLSASFDERIDNIITGSGGGGNYLPITGGTLTGNLTVSNASVGIGVAPSGVSCLAVGGSGTSTNGAHNSVVVGENCQATVWNAFVAGRENRVEGDGAFGAATGFRNRVNKMAGYAGGCRSTASAEFATAIGFGAEAASKGQVVLGAFNIIDRNSGTGSYAVILGNGKSSTWNQDNVGDVVRSNALAIKWDGGIDITYSGSTITLQDKLAELEASGGSVDLSGYATTESVLQISESISESLYNVTPDLNNYATNVYVTGLSSSFDQRIDSIVAVSGGIDPSQFAGAPVVLFETDGTTGLQGVNNYSNSRFTIDDNSWQLTNRDFSNYDRLDCYFTDGIGIVTVLLDSAAYYSSSYGDGEGYVGMKISQDVLSEVNTNSTHCMYVAFKTVVAVDSTKTKLQVAIHSGADAVLSPAGKLYKIVGYPALHTPEA